eukprot:255965_1
MEQILPHPPKPSHSKARFRRHSVDAGTIRNTLRGEKSPLTDILDGLGTSFEGKSRLTRRRSSEGDALPEYAFLAARHGCALPELDPIDELEGFCEGGEESKTDSEVDALAYLKRGCPMLKYGKWGYPHFRHFQISKDCSRLVWYSSGKRISQTSIHLADVDELMEGQCTDAFARYPNERMAPLSFSLVYSERTRTLDVTCLSAFEWELWTRGLRVLMENAKQHYCLAGAEDLNELRMKVARDKEKRVEIPVHRRNSVHDITRSCTQADILHKRYKETVLRFQKLRRSIQKSFRISEGMKIRVEEISQELANALIHLDNGDINSARFHIWQAGVEIESFDNKLHAIFT